VEELAAWWGYEWGGGQATTWFECSGTDKPPPAIAAGPTSPDGNGWPNQAGSVAYVTDPHKWVIHGERLVDDTPHVSVSLADVELLNHVRFTQYVFRMRRCAMTVVLDDPGERVLMMSGGWLACQTRLRSSSRS